MSTTPIDTDRRAAPAAAAWAVHFYTALGAAIALLALRAIDAGDYRQSLLWLYAAGVIDATDGWLARRARVERWTPQFDGTLLDNIVDYLTFVFVPAYFVVHAGLVPAGWSVPVACAIVLSSAYGFSHRDAKSADHFFRGFPSYWNIVAFYLYALGSSTIFNATIVLGLCGLVFVPVGYVYPSRTPVLKQVTVSLGVVWAGLTLAAIGQLPDTSLGLVWVSLLFPVYYFTLSLCLHVRRASRVASGASTKHD